MNRLRTLAAAVALPLAFAACESDPSGSGTARVSVLLTDAPGDFVTADVEILEIYLLGHADSDPLTEDDDLPGGRLTLYSGGEIFDLLTLRNGVTAELANAVIPPGTYNEIRLIVGEATVETENGTIYSTEDGTLKCPSCAQSGLKVKLPNGGIRLEEGNQSIIIDFDVAQSFGHQAGNSGKWVMHPVIRATRVEAAGGIRGSVTLAEGVVLPTCGGGQVDLTHFVPTATFGELTLTGATEADGDLSFTYVTPALYTLGFTETVNYDNGDTLTFVAEPSVGSGGVGAGEVLEVDYLITSATCTVAEG